MPITYSIDHERGVVLTTASGVLTDDELLHHKRKMTSDPNFKPGLVGLSDIREIAELAVTTEGIRSLVKQDALDAERLKGFKLAIVASDDVVFGMARMYQTMTQDNVFNVRIFRDLDEAKKWLGRL